MPRERSRDRTAPPRRPPVPATPARAPARPRLAGRPRVVVLYGAVAEGAPPDEQDTLAQVRAVSESLLRQDFEALPLAMTLRLDALRDRLAELRPRLVFNLVEAVDGRDALLPLGPLVLEALGIPYTGASLTALVRTGDKRDAKRALARAGIPTPPLWRSPAPDRPAHPPDARWIVKSVTEHASRGLDEGAVVRGDAAVAETLRERRQRLGGRWFAERYVPGREFNLSLLDGPEGPEVLPVAEIRFQGFPPGAPHIVGYAAKWAPDSAASRGTPRAFETAPGDEALHERLRTLARRCWEVFELRGYARVDFRVDATGSPFVLEINANPCLAPDAGFVAAAARAGLSFARLVHRLVEAMLPPPAADSPPTAAAPPRRTGRPRPAPRAARG